MTPRSAAEQGLRTRAGQSLLRQWSGHVNEPEVRIVVLAIEAEAAAGTEDAPMHTDEEYIEYGVVQYRRGRAQAEAEAATAAVPTDADAWQAGYEACWNRLKDAGRLLPSDGAAVPLDVDKMKEEIRLNSVSAAAHLIPATDWISLPVLGRILDRLSASTDEDGRTP